MLTPNQTLTLKLTAVALAIPATGTLALLKRSFDLENKAMALGKVVLANIDKLSDEDIQLLKDAGMKFTD